MNTLTSNNAFSLDNTLKTNDMEQEKNSRIDANSVEIPNVLHPDDSLMKKFQDALRDHLIRIDNKLNSEILDLVSICNFFVCRDLEENLRNCKKM